MALHECLSSSSAAIICLVLSIVAKTGFFAGFVLYRFLHVIFEVLSLECFCDVFGICVCKSLLFIFL